MAGAEAHARQALELSRRDSAKAFELRAAMSLGHVLRDTGRRDEARALLQDTYGWFTEGFATKDLREARALLGELA
jgi:predicted ATPase